MKFPITVNNISFDTTDKVIRTSLLTSTKIGGFVYIRPCAEKYEDKTFLGLYLGDIAQGVQAQYNKEAQELVLATAGHNPAILVPDLNKIIFGKESWWGGIKNEDDLKKITDADINRVWYMKALVELQAADKTKH